MNEEAEDFAAVGIFDRKIVLEANEWDSSLGLHRVVTLYLTPAHALELAKQLASIAEISGQNAGSAGNGYGRRH